MDVKKLDMFFKVNSEKFPEDKLALIRDKMAQCDDSRFAMIASVKLKNPKNMLLVSIFLGGYGIDRFMLGDIAMGALKFFTAGLFCILWIADIFTIQNKTKELNYNKIMQVL